MAVYNEEEGPELDDVEDSEGPSESAEGAEGEAPAPPPQEERPDAPLLATLPDNYQRKVRNGEMTLAQAIAQRSKAQDHAAARIAQRAKRTERLNEELLRRLDRLERRMRGEDVEEDEREPEGPPDPDTDPLGHVVAKVDELAQKLEERDSGAKVDAITADVEAALQEDYQRVTEQYPDYPDAERFMFERARDDEYARLEARFPEYPPDALEAEAARIVIAKAGELAVSAYAKGQSLHEAVMRQALHLGWRPAGAQPRRKPAPGAERMQRQSARMQAAGPARGNARPQPVSSFREALEDASDEDFEKLLRRYGNDEDAAFKELARNLMVD